MINLKWLNLQVINIIISFIIVIGIYFCVVYAQVQRLSTQVPQNLCLIKKTLNNVGHQSLLLNWPVLSLSICEWLVVTEMEALQAHQRAEFVI